MARTPLRTVLQKASALLSLLGFVLLLASTMGVHVSRLVSGLALAVLLGIYGSLAVLDRRARQQGS